MRNFDKAVIQQMAAGFAEAAPCALIGEAGIRKAVAQHGLACIQCRQDHLINMPRGRRTSAALPPVLLPHIFSS